MQYKMLNEVLEVTIALQPKDSCTNNTFDTLLAELEIRQKHNELTAKQKRVLNCLQTVVRARAKKGANSAINV